MMAYQVHTNNGYIVSIARGTFTGNVSDPEYKSIEATIKEKPIAPDGFDYRLTTALEWELHELPAVEPDPDEVATEADYLAALDKLGMSADD